MQFSGMRATIVPKKPEHTPATLPEATVSRGRSVSKKRSIQGKSNHGSILRQTCRYPSVNSTKQKRAAKQGISVCSRITRLNNQTKSQRQANYSHKRRVSDDKNAVAAVKNCTTIGLRLARLASTGFSKWNSPGETRCKKSWDQFEKYGSLSLRYVKQVSGKRKDHRLEKYKSKFFIREVPTL